MITCRCATGTWIWLLTTRRRRGCVSQFRNRGLSTIYLQAHLKPISPGWFHPRTKKEVNRPSRMKHLLPQNPKDSEQRQLHQQDGWERELLIAPKRPQRIREQQAIVSAQSHKQSLLVGVPRQVVMSSTSDLTHRPRHWSGQLPATQLEYQTLGAL